jgi:hypothetical protein
MAPSGGMGFNPDIHHRFWIDRSFPLYRRDAALEVWGAAWSD